MDDLHQTAHITKKQKSYFIAAAAFLMFLLLGIWVASRQKEDMNNSRIPINLTESQQNYLLVQVNDLETRTPRLVSVWAAFVYHTDSTHLVLLPLFPNPDQKVNAVIARKFRINGDGTLAKTSISKLERQYDIQVNGYIIVDNPAITTLADSLLGQSITPMADTPSAENDIRSVIATAKVNLTELCELLQQENGATLFNKVHWLELLPAHFKTSLSFETLTRELESLGSSNQVQTCEVLDY